MFHALLKLWNDVIAYSRQITEIGASIKVKSGYSFFINKKTGFSCLKKENLL